MILGSRRVVENGNYHFFVVAASPIVIEIFNFIPAFGAELVSDAWEQCSSACVGLQNLAKCDLT